MSETIDQAVERLGMETVRSRGQVRELFDEIKTGWKGIFTEDAQAIEFAEKCIGAGISPRMLVSLHQWVNDECKIALTG